MQNEIFKRRSFNMHDVIFLSCFSFVTVGNSTEESGGGTAFFGCDKGKCCACYGPPGGKGVYCKKECQPVNGGTITKRASAWFWVRLNPPSKVWEKCMEYKSEDESGKSAWYKLVGDRNIPVKGRCGNSESLINDGVVVLKDGEALNNLPAISGLLAYREDNQTLHVRKNELWKILPDEGMINEKLARINAMLEPDKSSCLTLSKNRPDLSSGVYFTGSMRAYCDLPSGWTLVARFSNKDGKNWMQNADFWFDRVSTYGQALNPLHDEDMFSVAFWSAPANELKITRSDDSSHTALLETNSNCLKGKTFRQHIISFGNFRNQAAWADEGCHSSCSIKYGGQYQSTSGFEMHSCSSDIQNSNYIGFWCEHDADAAVMMIGGGGNGCNRADHGIGITEENTARFGGSLAFLDFGYQKRWGSGNSDEEIEKTYALNLWVR